MFLGGSPRAPPFFLWNIVGPLSGVANARAMRLAQDLHCIY